MMTNGGAVTWRESVGNVPEDMPILYRKCGGVTIENRYSGLMMNINN